MVVPSVCSMEIEVHSKVAIYGTGGFGREVAWLLSACPALEPVCFIDDNEASHGRLLGGLSVMGLAQAQRAFPGVTAVLAVGSPKLRQHLAAKASDAGFSFEPVIHPSVFMSPSVRLGTGALICAGSVLTTNIELGSHVQINLACTIGHDVIIGDYSTLAPGVHVSGWVCAGKRVFIGTGAVIMNGTKEHPLVIGDDVIIGAGACVTKSIPPGLTVVGVPAKPIRRT